MPISKSSPAVLALMVAASAANAAPLPTLIHRFSGAATGKIDGATPSGALISDSAGTVYGTTATGGSAGFGTVFRLLPPAPGSTAYTSQILYNFQGNGDGAYPLGALAVSPNGTLYGTTSAGGAAGLGTVFALAPQPANTLPWPETILQNFTGNADGAAPSGPISLSGNTLYGTTQLGGAANLGTVFRLAAPVAPATVWVAATLHSFIGTDGANPGEGVTRATDGTLYGTATFGGPTTCPGGCGTIFALTPSPTAPRTGPWTLTTLHGFGAPGDGSQPQSTPLITADGIYATTMRGGAYASSAGTVVSLKASPAGWVETVEHSFSNGGDGAYPRGALITDNTRNVAPAGTLYGTTASGGGGPNARGLVFALLPAALSPGGTAIETKLAAFASGKLGATPLAGLLATGHGTLLGTASASTKGLGTVYAVP